MKSLVTAFLIANLSSFAFAESWVTLHTCTRRSPVAAQSLVIQASDSEETRARAKHISPVGTLDSGWVAVSRSDTEPYISLFENQEAGFSATIIGSLSVDGNGRMNSSMAGGSFKDARAGSAMKLGMMICD